MWSKNRNQIIKEIHDREKYWMSEWEKSKIFQPVRDPKKKKFFLTFPFPYMNGSLHLGHGYTATRLDVIARYKRMKGFNVLFPWAWHWTGEAVMGICHRIEDGDKGAIERLIKLDGVPEELIDKFKDPIYLVKFFTERGREDVKRIGYSIDWTREFHTSSLHPLYNKFVEWQIRKLYNKGLIVQGPYPVVWCPRDKSPTGDHDRMVGEGVRPEEYTLIKFKLVNDDLYLVAATFRPETIYGTTNVWLNPDIDYVIASVNGEKWLISRQAAEKLREQLRKVNIIEVVAGRHFIGKLVLVPIINRVVPILPAKFVDPEVATGVVYSVPAHAPYDWLALKDLKERVDQLPDELKDIVRGLYPISIISVEGYGDYPAVEICEKMGITSQDDPRADEATHEIYSKEFHTGKMKDECFDVAGLPVSEAKEVVKELLIEKGLGDIMYDLPETVICRCGTKCIVKILSDQWSLKYSDENWKELAKKAIEKMNFYPPEIKNLFIQYVDWYRDWPCTRKTGLGTPFPLSKDWIVETLTDSTIYMAFYIISKYYNSGLIDVKDIDDSFFDYVILGVGDPEKIAKGKLTVSLLKEIREDFKYWYPVDLRMSGKDLISNHLTFYIFHHTAIFPEEMWPRGIAANGFIRLEGQPMSKTKGIFISLRDAMDRYGADVVRVTLALAADGLEDPSWYAREAETNLLKLEGFKELINQVLSKQGDKELEHYDKVFISKYRELVKEVEDSLDNILIARAGRIIINEIPSLLRGYIRKTEVIPSKIVNLVLESWIKMLSLYAPYLAEDIWHNILGKDGYVSVSTWTSYEEIPLFKEDLLIEKYARSLIEDVKSVLEIYKAKARKLEVYVAENWKWELLEILRETIKPGRKISIKELIKSSIERMKDVNKELLVKAVNELYKRWHKDYISLIDLTDIINNSDDEFKILRDYVSHYIKDELGLDITIDYGEKHYEIEKVHRALPLKPAFLIK